VTGAAQRAGAQLGQHDHQPISPARFWGTILVILVPAIIGEAVFLAPLASQPGGGDARTEIAVGGAVAGVLALASSLLFLRSGLKSLLYGLAAAALDPLWFAYAILTCLTGECS
jgi:hypothetical protein